MHTTVAAGLFAAVALWGCAVPGPAATAPPASSPGASTAAASGLPTYRCDQGIEFTVRFAEDTAEIDAGARGREVLLRDAGGVTPQQSVYSNPRLRAEFGLGANGREAVLRYPQPLVAHCQRQ